MLSTESKCIHTGFLNVYFDVVPLVGDGCLGCPGDFDLVGRRDLGVADVDLEGTSRHRSSILSHDHFVGSLLPRLERRETWKSRR